MKVFYIEFGKMRYRLFQQFSAYTSYFYIVNTPVGEIYVAKMLRVFIRCNINLH